MASLQFNKDNSEHRWFSISYQSNELINDEVHGQVKKIIGDLLRNKLQVNDIHSYIHGNIIVEIKNSNITTFNKIVELLSTPLVNHAPELLFSIIAIAKGNDNKSIMYIHGDDKMDDNFRNSIGIV